MGIVKAVIERGLRRTLWVIYFNPHPQLPVEETGPESCSGGQSHPAGGSSLVGSGRKQGEVRGRRDWVVKERPPTLCICPLSLTSPAGRGAEAWEQRVSPAMLPVGLGFGGPTPSVPAALTRPEEASLPQPSVGLLGPSKLPASPRAKPEPCPRECPHLNPHIQGPPTSPVPRPLPQTDLQPLLSC